MSPPAIKRGIDCLDEAQIEKVFEACSSPSRRPAASSSVEAVDPTAARCQARVAATLELLTAVAAMLRGFRQRA